MLTRVLVFDSGHICVPYLRRRVHCAVLRQPACTFHLPSRLQRERRRRQGRRAKTGQKDNRYAPCPRVQYDLLIHPVRLRRHESCNPKANLTLSSFTSAVYRTIELSDGWTGRIISTEVYFSKLLLFLPEVLPTR